jgi:putative chitinase
LGLNPDGDFGQNTENAVKSWQTKNGLTPDGVIGDGSWGKLFPTKPSNIDLNKLKGHIPDNVIAQIPGVMEKFGVNTVLRLSHFLAQSAHESGNFKAVSENLNYDSNGLKKIFPSYFPGNLSDSYAHKPEMIASRVYGSRMGNGNEASKQGWTFRGRGYLQTTGYSNVKEFSDFIGEDCVSNPDLISTKYPLMSAAFFFKRNNLFSICDKGSSVDVVKELTKRINGGYLGLDDRIAKFNDIFKLLV